MEIQIAPLSAAFLHRVRAEGIDDQGQPVQRFRSAEGGEPCRDVLRRAHPGEEVLLASFSPFSLAGPYKEYGPVFILASPDKTSVFPGTLPVPTGRQTDYFGSQLVLRAYRGDESILDAVMVAPAAAASAAEQFLQLPEVSFVHARFPTFGCFACRIERKL